MKHGQNTDIYSSMSKTDWQTAACELIRLALREDLGDHGDMTAAAQVS